MSADGEISSIYILRSAQRQGFGSALMGAMAQQLRWDRIVPGKDFGGSGGRATRVLSRESGFGANRPRSRLTRASAPDQTKPDLGSTTGRGEVIPPSMIGLKADHSHARVK